MGLLDGIGFTGIASAAGLPQQAMSETDARNFLELFSNSDSDVSESDVSTLRAIFQGNVVSRADVILSVNHHYLNIGVRERDKVRSYAHADDGSYGFADFASDVRDSVHFTPGLPGQPPPTEADIRYALLYLEEVKTADYPLADDHLHRLADLIKNRVIYPGDVLTAVLKHYSARREQLIERLR